MKRTIINIDPSVYIQRIWAKRTFYNKYYYKTFIIVRDCYNYQLEILCNPNLCDFSNNWTGITLRILAYGMRGIENVSNVVILWMLLIGKCCFRNGDSQASVNNPHQAVTDEL